MKTLENVKVTSAQQVVATLNIQQFDSIPEAVTTLGEKEVLDIINVQHKTNQMNTARQKASGTPPSKQLRAEAFNAIMEDDTKLAKMKELNLALKTATDDMAKAAASAAVQKFIDDEIEGLKQQYEAKRKASQSAAGTSEEE